MLPAPAAEPKWIAEPGELQQMVREIAQEPRLAIDTESNSLFAYQEKVCLIQISTLATDYLVDPLALHDISNLAEIFANPKQLKIFHAAEYDLICLKRDYAFEVNNIFDTMAAARILGEPQVGLGNLLNLRFGITLDKHFQRANWGVRPLSQAMLDYARLDTHYLFALQEVIEKELKEKGLWELAQEDFILACETQPQPQSTNGINCWKVSGAAHITPRQAAVLQELCHYRDQQARQMDLPHFKVLSNDLLLELSQDPPHSLDELEERKHLNTRLLRKHGAGLLRAIEIGEKAKPVTRQRRTSPDDAFLQRLDKLRNWRKVKAKELKVESDVVLPRTLMEDIAGQDPKSKPQLREVMKKNPWRYQQYGETILNILGGNTSDENHV